MDDRRFTYTAMFETVRGVGNLLAPDDFEYLTEIPADTPDTHLVIHLSCMAHYTPQIPYLAKQILKRLGHDCLIVGGPDNCCGELHKVLGDHDLEKQAAKIAMFGFRRVRPRTVLSICPDCDDVFRSHDVARQPYKHANISTLFISFLDRLKSEMRPVNLQIVPHFHTINEYRQADADNMMTIMRAVPGLEILDAKHALGPGNHCQTLRPMPPDDQARMFEEARELGADAVVVPYHSCYRQHCKMQLRSGVTVHHYFNILAMALGVPFSEPFKEMRLLDSVDAVVDALNSKIARLGYDESVVRAQIKRAIFC
ncbi:MAG: heterodisulfide reductase-related iron-sulfur binding cluster [Pseudorhodoplanes sp.]